MKEGKVGRRIRLPSFRPASSLSGEQGSLHDSQGEGDRSQRLPDSTSSEFSSSGEQGSLQNSQGEGDSSQKLPDSITDPVRELLEEVQSKLDLLARDLVSLKYKVSAIATTLCPSQGGDQIRPGSSGT